MASDDDLRKQDLEAASARLIEHKEGLDELRSNPEIEGYAAEVYLVEAESKLEAALVDVEHAMAEAVNGRKEKETSGPGGD